MEERVRAARAELPCADLRLAEQIRAGIAQHHFEVRGEPHTITTSVGVASWGEGMQTSADLLRLAEALLRDDAPLGPSVTMN